MGSAWYLAKPSLPTLCSYLIELYHEMIRNKNFITKEKRALAINSIYIPVSHDDRGLLSHR